VIAGSRGKTGAGLLSARAALRAGAGLATLASASPDLAIAGAYCPELMTEALPQRDGAIDFSRRGKDVIRRLLAGKNAVVYGPGIGVSAASRRLTRWLIGTAAAPLVVDADGLNALAGHLEWLRGRRAEIVLTPHPGEMARLIGGATADIQRDRIGCVRSFAEASKVTVVLKGARTLVASPDGRVGINPTGNPGMASGGMGDALAGMIGAALAQGLDPREAAEAAVFWHGDAGDRIAARSGAAGILASDVIDELPSALAALQDRWFGADGRADRR
jgi:NAD(P)H-hydrate epimerase